MTAALLVLEPIFEADLPLELYAYRPRRIASSRRCSYLLVISGLSSIPRLPAQGL
jgi:hypothetical protein